MNIWIGTDLAADILGSVKDTPGDKVAQVIVKNANEPYYKGICSDAKRCGVEIITAEKLVHNCTYPTISLNPYIRVPDAINLDGGYLTPCTAEASMRLLRRYGFIFQGADVLLLGRSERVGEPLSHLLTRANATVTIAHSLTKSSSIWRLAQNADLIISSVGRADFTELELKPTATVVDIGGDFVGISGIQNYVPFIGGVGPVTRAILMEHILKFRRFKEDKKKTMLKIENTEVMGWEHAIRGMRNPKNSWEKSDSNWRYIAPAQRENHILASYSDDSEFWIGPNDADLMNRLRNAGTDHRKFMRMITVYLDITAPLYTDKSGKKQVRTQDSTKMAETRDAYSLSSGTPQEQLYADYANKMKSLGNQARKEMVHTGKIEYSASAKETYLPEYKSLTAKLNIALKNAPRERQAQVIANSVVAAKEQENPDMTKSEKKKAKSQALSAARTSVGAKRENIKITDREWEAIQAGAISENKLYQILNNTDLGKRCGRL